MRSKPASVMTASPSSLTRSPSPRMTWWQDTLVPCFPLPRNGRVRRECQRVIDQGEATTYIQAHIVARWVLGILHPEPVNCLHCGISELDQPCRLVSQMHAALDWANAPADRLRTTDRGRVFSIRPDLDYIPLCGSCHIKYDRKGWRRRTGHPA